MLVAVVVVVVVLVVEGRQLEGRSFGSLIGSRRRGPSVRKSSTPGDHPLRQRLR